MKAWRKTSDADADAERKIKVILFFCTIGACAGLLPFKMRGSCLKYLPQHLRSRVNLCLIYKNKNNIRCYYILRNE